MTRKDFINIANTIRNLDSDIRANVAEKFANDLSFQYPSFNKTTFLNYILK